MEKKYNFESISEVMKILRKPREKIEFVSPKEMIDLIKKTPKSLTIHLYPTGYWNKKEKCLLDLNRWSYHQIYLCFYNQKAYCLMGHGDTSGSRQLHNEMIDYFIKNRELRDKIISIIAVNFKGFLLSYYFYNHFAYSNCDIGSNWDTEIRNRLKKSKLPYSYVYGGFDKKTVKFRNKGEEIIIYKQIEEDISRRKFEEKLKRVK